MINKLLDQNDKCRSRQKSTWTWTVTAEGRVVTARGRNTITYSPDHFVSLLRTQEFNTPQISWGLEGVHGVHVGMIFGISSSDP